jgi:signal transduction histidine kinase
MKIGSRLTLVLLLILTPLVMGYTYWSMQRSTQVYAEDLKRELRAAGIGLAPALTNDIGANEWDQVQNVLDHVGAEGTEGALYRFDGHLLFASRELPRALVESSFISMRSTEAPHEFDYALGERRWFCRLIPLHDRRGQSIGYLLLAQDWSDIREDLRARTMDSALAGLLLVAVIATVIPLMIRRYVSRPLAELSRRVVSFSNDDPDLSQGGDEVRLLTEEFRRLGRQLTQVRTDLTEKHRRELELERRLERADRLATIGTLASGLAHEIGNPLGVIRGRAEYLINSRPPSAKINDGLRIILGQIDRISRVVRMLLDYAREHESPRVICDLRSITEHALNLIEPEAARRNVEIVKQLGDEPCLIRCDSDQIQQVVINLAINALDAMAETGGTLRIFADIRVGAAGRYACLLFEDTGGGIPSEFRDRIFDPFFTTKEPGKGTGMGLSVSQTIIRDHNGDITLDTEAPGARFLVTLPIGQNEAESRTSGVVT